MKKKAVAKTTCTVIVNSRLALGTSACRSASNMHCRDDIRAALYLLSQPTWKDCQPRGRTENPSLAPHEDCALPLS